MENEVRPIYEALMGLLSSAPSLDKQGYILNKPTWEQYHTFIEKLNQVTKDDFNSYKVTVIFDEQDQKISLQEYRSKLNSLIMYLHGKFFHKEPMPFSGQPSTIFSQSQSQSVQIAMIMDFQSMIDKKLYSSKLNEKEKNFLEKIKAKLPTISSLAELVSSILSIAKDLNLDINKASELLKFS